MPLGSGNIESLLLELLLITDILVAFGMPFSSLERGKLISTVSTSAKETTPGELLVIGASRGGERLEILFLASIPQTRAPP